MRTENNRRKSDKKPGSQQSAKHSLSDDLARRERRREREYGLLTKKLQELSDDPEAQLRDAGTFLRAHDGRLCFFSKHDPRLLDLSSRSFLSLVARVLELPATDTKVRRAVDCASSSTRQLPKTTATHSLAAYDARTSTLAVSLGSNSILIHERGKEWKPAANGSRGLYFLTDPDAESCEVELKSESGQHLAWFLQQFCLSPYRDVDAAKQRRLLLDLLLSWLFLGPNRMKLVPLFLGPSGSGKSTALKLLGQLLVGPRFEPCGIESKRIFVDNITSRAVYALDNVDSNPSWLEEAIASYAAGRRQRVRGSHATGDLAAYAPTAILLMASHAPRIQRPDVVQRIVPFYLERPREFVREEILLLELARRRDGILGELLSAAARMADRISQRAPQKATHQNPDFASFVIAAAEDPEEAQRLLRNLETAQADLHTTIDGLCETLQRLLPRESIDQMPIAELFKKCSEIATEKHLIIPRTVQGFGQRFTNLKASLEPALNVTINEQRIHANTRVVTITQRTSMQETLHEEPPGEAG